MAFDKKGTFTLGKNRKREKETQPEYTGTLTDEDGNEFWLNAWIKESKGEKFFSGRIKRKEARQGQTAPQSKPQSLYDDPLSGGNRLSGQLDAEIPFIYEWR